MRLIYLDHNQTTPMAGAAREAMLPFLYEFFGLPGGDHWTSAAVTEAIEDARSHLAVMLDCEPHSLVFTSGGTESINLALIGGCQVMRQRFGDDWQILVSTWASSTVLAVLRFLIQAGTLRPEQVSVVNCHRLEGIEPKTIVDACRDLPTLLSLPVVDGRTGIVLRSERIATRLIEAGVRGDCLLHFDASDAVGKRRVNCVDLDADLLTFSGHRMYAAKGCGALFIREGFRLPPQIHGTWGERGQRNGTPNVPGIVALGAAALLVDASLKPFDARCAQLWQQFEEAWRVESQRPVPYVALADQLPNTRLLDLRPRDLEDLSDRHPELCIGLFGTSESRPLEQPILRLAELPDSAFSALANIRPLRAASLAQLSLGWSSSVDDVRAAAVILAAFTDD